MLYYYKGAIHLVNMEKIMCVRVFGPPFCNEVLKGIQATRFVCRPDTLI